MSARATTIGFSLLALFLAVVPLTAANEYSLRLFMIFLIYAIVSVGLNVLVGLAGLVSLGPGWLVCCRLLCRGHIVEALRV
jgi:branched-chain amino acid transport system ATP-binding protein/branched-chain amino acid transport system permease protein